MSAVRELLHQIPDPNLSNNERVRLRCQLARQFEKTGNFDAACRAMGEVWLGLGKPINLDALDKYTCGEVLLRAGVLTGWIGSIRQIKGSQQIARNILNQSMAIFESLSDTKKLAEAQIEIAYCYVREGALDVARLLYADTLSHLEDCDGDLKALAVLRGAIVELMSNRLDDALNMVITATVLFERSTSHVLKGCFHSLLATVFKNLGTADTNVNYMDHVFSEFAAASFHFERAGHARYQAGVENNLAMFFLQLERFAEAHEHLDRAQALFTQLDDNLHLARIEETRARVLLAEGAVLKAEKIIDAAIRALERGDQKSLLAEALTTRGVALARLERWEEARATLERAIDTAQQAGDSEKAGHAALALIEQLPGRLPEHELCLILERARGFLKYTQNTATLRRLAECTWRALSIIHTTRPDWTNFSLNEILGRHEGRFIQMALEDSRGSVTKAASLLGLPGHQSLNFILQNRHPELLKARTPIKRRRRSTLRLVELREELEAKPDA